MQQKLIDDLLTAMSEKDYHNMARLLTALTALSPEKCPGDIRWFKIAYILLDVGGWKRKTKKEKNGTAVFSLTSPSGERYSTEIPKINSPHKNG